MAAIEPKALRERCERRLSGLRAARQPMDFNWTEVGSYFPPKRGRWLTTRNGAFTEQADKVNTRLLTGEGAQAANILANGMFSGLSAPSRPWFRITTADPDAREFGPVKQWLRTVQNRLYELFASTNFYNATHGGYKELGLFGVEAAIMVSHPTERAVVHQLTAGEYFIGLSDSLQVDTLYREMRMTVAQVVQRFSSGNGTLSAQVRDNYAKGNLDFLIPVIHAIEPNPDRIPGKLDRTNMEWRSIYWEAGSPKDEVLDFGGFKTKPFWAPRWDAVGSEVYSTSPAMEALGDIKRVQLKELRIQQAMDIVIKPPLRATPMMQSATIQNVPGGITFAAGPDNQPIAPLYEIKPDLQWMLQDKNEARMAVREHFYADLFMAISQMEGVQPRNDSEINERVGEKMTQLGPVVERVENEKLRVAIDIGFNLLMKMNAVPPPPDEMQGMGLKIEFISTLSQMQRGTTLTGIERTFALVNAQAQFTPDIVDKVDVDAGVDEYADILGIPPSMIRTADDVAKLRQARQQAQQAQQAAEMAKPAADYAKAAKDASEAQIGQGRNALQAMMGEPGQAQYPA